MPYSIVHIEHEAGLVISWMGSITGEEVRRFYHERFSPIDRFKTLQYILVDYTQVSDAELSPGDIQYIAKLSKEVSKYNKELYAAAAMSTELLYGLARMWQLYNDDDITGWHTMVTKTRPEAEKWLREVLDVKLTFRE